MAARLMPAGPSHQLEEHFGGQPVPTDHHVSHEASESLQSHRPIPVIGLPRTVRYSFNRPWTQRGEGVVVARFVGFEGEGWVTTRR